MAASDKIIMAPGWEPILEAYGLKTTSAIYALDQDHVRTRSGTSEVRKLSLEFQGQNHTLFLKKYWFPTWSKRVRPMFRGTFFGRPKVRQEFENLLWLRKHGFDAPEPVACGEERRWGWLTRSWLLSVSVPNAVGLDSFLAHELAKRPLREQRSWKKNLIDQLSIYTRRLHQARFVHNDYFWRNIILDHESLGHFYLIDAHKGFVGHASQDRRWKTADLACLDAAAPWFFRRTERLKFFLRYLNQSSLHPSDKIWISQILHLAEPMRSRQVKRVWNAPEVTLPSLSHVPPEQGPEPEPSHD